MTRSLNPNSVNFVAPHCPCGGQKRLEGIDMLCYIGLIGVPTNANRPILRQELKISDQTNIIFSPELVALGFQLNNLLLMQFLECSLPPIVLCLLSQCLHLHNHSITHNEVVC